VSSVASRGGAVGAFAANALRLHDVIGNVAQVRHDADDDIAKAPGRPHGHRGGHHADAVDPA
jgi:hypothetical protein